MYLHTTNMTPVTGLHYICSPTKDCEAMEVHTNSQSCHSCQCPHSWPSPWLLDLAPTTTCVFDISPYNYIGSWPHSQVYQYYQLQPLPLLSLVPSHWTWRYCSGPKQPLQVLSPSMVLTKNQASVNYMNPKSLTHESPCSSRLVPQHTSSLGALCH